MELNEQIDAEHDKTDALSEDLKSYADGMFQDVKDNRNYKAGDVYAVAGYIKRKANEVAKLEEGLATTRIELGMALTEKAVVVMKYEQLEAENETNSNYISGTDKRAEHFYRWCGLVALLTTEVLDRS